MADRETHRARLMRAIHLAIDANPPPVGVAAALEAHHTVEALIGSLAFILATTPSDPSPRALRAYCGKIAEQLQRKTEAIRQDPAFSSTVPSEGRPS